MMEFRLLPFQEATKSFKTRTPVTADVYKQLVDEAKAKAFTVSSITKLEIVEDVYRAMDKAIAEKTLFSDFKKSITDIIKKRGWTGEAPYRLETIFRTNIQQAFQAGHYAQLMDVVDSRPFWQYVAVMDGRTRPAHAAMNGKVLPADSPFWKRNFPPNGFNCRCTVVSVSKSEIARENLEVHDDFPDIADKGFLSNPGEVNYRDILAQAAFDKAEKENWIPLIDYGPEKYDRTGKVSYEPMLARLGPTLKELHGNKRKLRELFREAIGAESSLVNTPDGSSIVLSEYLFDHLTFDGREAYFPLIRPLVENPYEIWLMPMKGERTGKIVMRKRFVRFFEDEKKRHVLVGEYQGGTFVGYTFFRGDYEKYLERKGFLLYGR